jgi:hypothetical protein
MATLYFPVLAFNPGQNITVRLGDEWFRLFNAGVMSADVYLVGSEAVISEADISQVSYLPFGMIPQEWIDLANYPGVRNLDELYEVLAAAYGIQFDSEALVSVIWFKLRGL